MQLDKQFQKVLIAAVLVSLIFGGIGGMLGGIYGKSHIIPWFQKFFLGEDVQIGEGTLSERAITQAVIEESATVSAVKKVAPAVVSIVVSKDISKINNSNNFSQIFGFPFNFGSPSAGDTSGTSGKTEIGGGTGFIISSDGLILTNKHVVSDEEAEYTVITNDDKKYDAKILATDPFLDIAVLKIEATDLPIVELGDSDKLELGQTVIAIGNSLGEYKNTVTKGVISGIGRRIEAGDNRGGSEVIEEAIQTDAAINPGNSGGPLVNLAGQVIGINTAMSQQGQLIGFSIPINTAKQDIESVKANGKIVRPWLGVRYVLINKEIAKENQLEKDYGALVARGQKETDFAVVPGSPADKAGLLENDIILELNSQKIDEEHPLSREIAKFHPGNEINLKILRKGEEKNIKVTLGEYNN
ncbi:MAG: trypsin-like peptidase domain-containing protein [Patescibacteria group bacterium]|jgi:serine protease Do